MHLGSKGPHSPTSRGSAFPITNGSEFSIGPTRPHDAKPSAITPELEEEFTEAVRQAMSAKRDPEAMRRAAERMDRMREETDRQHGLLDIGVPAIRELRGELPE